MTEIMCISSTLGIVYLMLLLCHAPRDNYKDNTGGGDDDDITTAILLLSMVVMITMPIIYLLSTPWYPLLWRTQDSMIPFVAGDPCRTLPFIICQYLHYIPIYLLAFVDFLYVYGFSLGFPVHSAASTN
ncbi:hypothetical protein F5X96DRAFT_612684 [Biscogniauxia mediterranea]|nr:hypothetical protein F5X96DRAFT_612684 [Biscogniauxia mediterranea]